MSHDQLIERSPVRKLRRLSQCFDISSLGASVFAFIGLVISLFTFYPGWMSPDSVIQYREAVTGVYVDWHPVLMAWWWRQLDKIYPGPFLLLLQNLLLYWSSAYLLYRATAARFGLGSWVFLLMMLCPGLMYPLGELWKDVVFATLMVCSWAYLVWVAQSRASIIIWEHLSLFGALVLALGVKTNGLTAIPFVVYFWCFVATWGRNLIERTAISIVLTGLVVLSVKVLESRLPIQSIPSFQYSQTYDLLAISVERGEVLLPDYLKRKTKIQAENVKDFYLVGDNNLFFYKLAGNLRTDDRAELLELHQKWTNEVLANPGIYLRHRLRNFASLLRFGERTAAIVADPAIIKNEFGLEFKDNSLSDWLKSTTERWPVLYFPWVYLVLGTVGAGLAELYAKENERQFVRLAFFSVMAFVAPHVFLVPASDYRYLYYANWLSLVIFCYGFLTWWVKGKSLASPQSI